MLKIHVNEQKIEDVAGRQVSIGSPQYQQGGLQS